MVVDKINQSFLASLSISLAGSQTEEIHGGYTEALIYNFLKINTSNIPTANMLPLSLITDFKLILKYIE